MPKSSPQAAERKSHMHVNATWVTFIAFEPEWMDFTSMGRQVPPGTALQPGEVIVAGYLGTGKADHTKSVWGRVYVCGNAGGRASCEAFSNEVQEREQFPKPHGTWIVCKDSCQHTLKNEFKVIQTHDIMADWPAHLSWNEVRNEIQRAKFTLFSEE